MLKARDTYFPPMAVTESSTYSNYPPGTWAGDPRAPWNQPDEDIDEYGDWDEEPNEDEEPAEPERVRRLYDELMQKARDALCR